MDEKLPRAILRVEKIHTFEKLDQVEAHNTRAIPAGTAIAQSTAEERIAEADAREAAILALKATAETRVAEAVEMEAKATQTIRKAETAQAAAQVHTNQLTLTRQEIADAQKNLVQIRDEIASGTQELTIVRGERGALRNEILQLHEERRGLAAEVANIKNARVELEADQEIHQISVDIAVGLTRSKRYARMNGSFLELFTGDQLRGIPAEKLNTEGFAPWLPKLVSAYEDLMVSRTKNDEVAEFLDNRRKLLALEYPEKQSELVRQTDEDIAALAQIAARHQQRGIGG